jgi:hypothetical protein
LDLPQYRNLDVDLIFLFFHNREYSVPYFGLHLAKRKNPNKEHIHSVKRVHGIYGARNQDLLVSDSKRIATVNFSQASQCQF